MTKIEFCSSEDYIYSNVVELVSKQILNIPVTEINGMYNNWFIDFDNETSKDFSWSRNLIPASFKLPIDACFLGIDFPTWLNYKATNKKIMLIGIDPLRNESAFKNEDINNTVLVGTPYALHYKFMRQGRTKEYWKFINLLLQEHSVYLTDIYKIFYYREKYLGTRSYNDDSMDKKNHQNILEQEMEIVKPDIIITMGALATRFLTNPQISPQITQCNVQECKLNFNSTPVIPMVHLSGGSYAKHKQAFLNANGKQGNNYGELYYEIIDALLKK